MADAGAKTPVVLIILDGFGYREDPQDNAIAHAKAPFWNQLWQTAPHMLVSGSGLDVGLPEGQMGNSEVGHMCLGAGRVIYQSITRLDKEIAEGDFFKNPAYTRAVDKAVANGGAVHLFGLLSPGGVHSHEEHIFAGAKLAAERGAKAVYLHAFLDGRDMPPRSAEPSLAKAEAVMAETGVGRVATVCGRFYAMDRDKRWERVQPAYELLTQGVAEFHAATATEALAQAYARGENDEFVKPTVVGEAAPIRDGDVVLFMNFRADRARQLTQVFVDEAFDGFPRAVLPKLSDFVMTTEYSAALNKLCSCAYPPESLANTFGDYIAALGKTQLRIAETEKYAHVTFFFSGGREELYEGEERILVPSPRVETYDLQPEMSAFEVTDKLVEAIRSRKFDAVICNYANGDMVGHTGVFEAAVKAVEVLDQCLARVCEAVREVGGDMLITADHGNLEQMQDYDADQPHTQHTTELVPLVYVGNKPVRFTRPTGRLPDVAPTLLKLMGLPQPAEMDGAALIDLA